VLSAVSRMVNVCTEKRMCAPCVQEEPGQCFSSEPRKGKFVSEQETTYDVVMIKIRRHVEQVVMIKIKRGDRRGIVVSIVFLFT
jgi:hypothetical protein